MLAASAKLVAVTAVATLRSDSTTPLRLNAVVAKDAVDAVPVKFPTKPPVEVIIPDVSISTFGPKPETTPQTGSCPGP